MNHRERYLAIMNYEPYDRMPVYFFGTWPETRARWKEEGLDSEPSGSSQGPQVPGMDPDWEKGMWNAHGLVKTRPISHEPSTILEEKDDYRIVKTPLGSVLKEGKEGSSIPMHIEEALKPTRESWERFKKFIDPDDPERRPDNLEELIEKLNARDCVTTFLAGSLYGWPRDWMGVEALSILPYDDPVLFEEIIEHMCDYFIALYRPFIEKVTFEFAYFFEDCCFKNGSLFSPDTYRKYYHKYYKKMIDFYHDHGVPFVMMDSDGKVDDLVPCWMESGFDMIFPIEVGTWKADPGEFRKQYGKELRIFGGVNKNVIHRGEEAIRAELEPLRPLAEQGGFIPIPDHRIPPDCSLEAFYTYIRVFKEVFK